MNDLSMGHSDKSLLADKIALSELDRSCKIPREKADAHLRKVQEIISEIAIQRNLNADICRTAAIMHDLWLYRHTAYSPEIIASHGPEGAKLAEQLLAPANLFSSEELSIIAHMIDRHDFIDAVDDMYCEALKDADCIANGKSRLK